MNKKLAFFVATLLCLLVIKIPQVAADLQVTKVSSTLNFMGNDVDSNGVLWAGDKNFSIWKSTDNGATFQFVYTLPHEAPRYPNPYSGIVWTVFVDSRNYLFVSCGGANNSLYRSTNGGATFTAVLNANDSTNRSFYIALTEDASGSLYTATYTVGSAQAQLLKSTDGGFTWTKIGSFNAFHFHNIKYNPANGYLYAITGERPAPVTSFTDSEKIFRSKDGGATWNLVVDRNDTLGTVYLAMTFMGSSVYVGQDYPNRTCQIHMFNDDGSNRLFAPQVVYSPPADGCMPFISGEYFNNTLVFANCAEAQNGTARIVSSVDGVNWNLLTSSSILSSDARWNMFTIHPKNAIFGTLKTGYSYQIIDVQPTPTPQPPTPLPTDTSQVSTAPIMLNPTTQPTPPLNPTPQPTPKHPQPTSTIQPAHNSTPTMQPTLTPQAGPSNQQKVSVNSAVTNYEVASLIAILGAIAFSITLLKKRHKLN